MLHSSRARRAILAVTGLTFLVIATASLIAPHTMAEPFRYGLSHVDSLSEFRAVYVGLWLAHVAACAMAIKHITSAPVGDVVGILVLGQGIGRLVSAALDGLPSAAILPMLVIELLGGTSLLLVRPSR